jgi:hypothetical protein
MPELEAIIEGAIASATAEPATETETSTETSEPSSEPSSESSSESDDTSTTTESRAESTSGETKPAIGADGQPKETTSDTAEKPDDEGKPEASEEDAFATEHNLKPKDKHGRENRLPYSAVKRIVGTAERKLAQTVIGRDVQKGEDPRTLITTHLGGLQETIREHTEEKDRINALFERPERFLEVLRTINPRYQELLGDPATGVRSRGEAAAREPVPTDMPEPDVEFGEGERTYSVDGLRRLLAWNTDQVEQRILKEVRPVLDDRQASEHMRTVILPAVNQKIQYAQANWPGFKENEAEILSVLQADSAEAERTGRPQKLALHDAYIQVREQRRMTDEKKLRLTQDEMRKKILAEMKQRPSSTSSAPGPSGKDAPAIESSDDPLTAVINKAISAAKLG